MEIFAKKRFSVVHYFRKKLYLRCHESTVLVKKLYQKCWAAGPKYAFEVSLIINKLLQQAKRVQNQKGDSTRVN